MNRLKIRAGLIMACIFCLGPGLLISLGAVLGDGASTVRSDIHFIERAVNDEDYGPLFSVLIFAGFFGVFGFIHGTVSRGMRQTRLLAASNPKAKDVFWGSPRYGFWDKHVYKLHPDGTDMATQ